MPQKPGILGKVYRRSARFFVPEKAAQAGFPSNFAAVITRSNPLVFRL
jgi:hypothetical protein